MATITELAEQLYDALVQHPDTGVVALQLSAPDWMTDVCRECHSVGRARGSALESFMLPDNWRFATIMAAAETISNIDPATFDPDDMGDLSSEFAQDVDVYNSDLLAWFSANIYRAGYVNDAVKCYGVDQEFDIWKAITVGQVMEREEIFNQLYSALEKRQS